MKRIALFVVILAASFSHAQSSFTFASRNADTYTFKFQGHTFSTTCGGTENYNALKNDGVVLRESKNFCVLGLLPGGILPVLEAPYQPGACTKRDYRTTFVNSINSEWVEIVKAVCVANVWSTETNVTFW